MGFDELIGDLQRKKERALQMGGPEKIKAQHAKGRLTARERIDRLLDRGSFIELGMLACSDVPGMEDKTPADALIIGYGTIAGQRVAVTASDFTVLAATLARVHGKKMHDFKEQINKYSLPHIFLGDGGGGRVPDGQGSIGMTNSAMMGSSSIFHMYTNLRLAPLITAVMGNCFGVPMWQACAADFVVQVKGSTLSVSGARALQKVIAANYTDEEMGGWRIHAEHTGIADRTAEDEEDYGIHEAWTAMTYVAGATSRIKVSHMVLVPTFRGPGLLAKMAATLDLFSGGRMDLSVGAGWYEREFHAFDFPWEDHKERIEREGEAVRIIRSLWTEPQVSFEGTYYRLDQAEVSPKPLQKPTPPIWIGGDSKRSMELAAELGDGWLVHGHQPHEIDSMFKKIRPLLGERAEGFGLGAAAFLIMGEDPDAATRKMNEMISPEVMERFQSAGIRHELNNRVSGSPQQCLDRIKAYEQVGLNRLILIFLDPEDAERFAEEVLPKLR